MLQILKLTTAKQITTWTTKVGTHEPKTIAIIFQPDVESGNMAGVFMFSHFGAVD